MPPIPSDKESTLSFSPVCARRDVRSACRLLRDIRGFMTMSVTTEAQFKAIDPEHILIVESVRGSEHPVHLMYVETIDGLYAPIGLRKPTGPGPFPIVTFASGNGGGGMDVIREYTQKAEAGHKSSFWPLDMPWRGCGIAPRWITPTTKSEGSLRTKRQRRQLSQSRPA